MLHVLTNFYKLNIFAFPPHKVSIISKILQMESSVQSMTL